MNKTELIEVVAAQTDLSKLATARVLEAVLEAIKAQLGQGNEVALLGFGTFAVSERPARTGRNPRTGEPLSIKAAKLVKFRVGKAFKDALN